MERKIIAIGVLSVLLGASVGACGAFALREVNMQREAMARQQRDLADIVAAESGREHMGAGEQTTGSAMNFAGQMGQ